MKLVIASDIHGAADWCKRLIDAIEVEQPDRVVLLGDFLYHGPRNNLPKDYNPKACIALLNAIAPKIIAVRGNCDAEVDQMVLDFECLADHNILLDFSTAKEEPTVANVAKISTLYLTHGHVFGPGLHNSVNVWPKLPEHAALEYGHTHIKVNQLLPQAGDGDKHHTHPAAWVFNPGSVGIPKDGTHSFGIYENGQFTHYVWNDEGSAYSPFTCAHIEL